MKYFLEFDKLADFYINWRVRAEQYTSGKFQGCIQLVRTPEMYAVDGEFSQSVSIQGSSTPQECSFYIVAPENANSVWWGHRFEPGQLVTLGPNVWADYHNQKGSKTQGISIQLERLKWAMQELSGGKECHFREDWSVTTPPEFAIDCFQLRLKTFLVRGNEDSSILTSAEGHRMEQEILRTLGRAFDRGTHHRGADLPLHARTKLTIKAEDLMRSQLRGDLGAVDLCAALGVSDRTLRQAFKEHHGIGPMVFYKTLRLNAVYADLKSLAPESELSIAAVARKWGFHHQGNFAADYFRMFAELPSQTARKRPGGMNL